MTTQSAPHDIRHTAIHEAGHAVACDELGVQWDQIVIGFDGTSSGLIGVEDDDGWPVPPGQDEHSDESQRAVLAWAEQQATIDLAGHAAIVTILGNANMGDGSAIEHGACEDFAKARNRFGDSESSDGFEQAKVRALEIVERRRDDIVKIADALVIHKRMDSQRFHIWLAYGVMEFDDIPVSATREGAGRAST